MTRFLPEYTLDNAPEPIRAIYAQIPQMSGMSLPALIYRTLATIPGGLEWCWSQVGALAQAGLIQKTSIELFEELEVPATRAFNDDVLRSVGVTPDHEARIVNALQAYNRGNPSNLIAVSVLLRLLTSPEAGKARSIAAYVPSSHWQAPPPVTLMTEPADLQTLSGTTLALMTHLGGLADERTNSAPNDGTKGNQPQLVPTLYRHFADTPGFLALLHAYLAPLYERGLIAEAIAQLKHRAAEKADVLLEPALASASTDAGPSADVMTVLQRFSSKIPEMIVVGKLVVTALERR